jgi:predicted transposase YdaD
MAEISHPWDTFMKLLMEKGAQAFASLALPGVQVGDTLDKELRVKNIRGDFFCNAYLNNLKIILHFEFQKSKDENMDRRMWEYNAAMDINTGKPVYSILVYLAKEKSKEGDSKKEATLVGSPYIREIPGTGMGHYFAFQVIKLWEITPEVLKQTGFEELLPLLPLTEGGQNLETVDDMITELVARNRSDLLELGHFCAGLVLKDEINRQWLKERFSKVREIIEQSWVYQETIEKGREEGRQQALQQTAIGIVAARFPELGQFATEIVETISDPNRLQTLTIELSIVSSQERAKELLLSFASAS